jgi:hypothetical protein
VEHVGFKRERIVRDLSMFVQSLCYGGSDSVNGARSVPAFDAQLNASAQFQSASGFSICAELWG